MDPSATPSGTRVGDPAPAEGPSPRPLLTVEDLASLLGLSVRGARQVLERGELPGFRVGRRWYLRREDLDDAISRRVVEARGARSLAVRAAGARSPAAHAPSARPASPARSRPGGRAHSQDPDAAVRILRGLPMARSARGTP